MFGVDDLLKLLDRVPLWKKISELPAKVEALEKRVAELENNKVAIEENKGRFIKHKGMLFWFDENNKSDGVAYCAKCEVPMAEFGGMLICFTCNGKAPIDHDDIPRTIAEIKL